MSNYVDSVLGSLKDIPSLETSSQPALQLIFDDARVISAHKALVLSYNQKCRKKVLHGLTVQLLNLISATYYKHFLGWGDAVILARRSSNNLPGDYLALDTTPDAYAFAGRFPDLLAAARSPNALSPQHWSVLLEVGALKRHEDGGDAFGQLKSHLKGLKRYRPDLFTVCGFSLDSGNVRLAALNPGGLTSSDPIPMEELAPWVAHVVQGYLSLSHRDPNMKYCPDQERFCRWDVRKAGHGLVVTPFHVGHAPGRTTFACFELGRLPGYGKDTSAASVAELDNSYDAGVVKGFWKMSLQRATSRGTEAELLTKLHKNGWVPGLVRHHPDPTMRDGNNECSAVLHPSGEEDVVRVKDILHLGSIGQPLSQCETVEELLDTMYDLLETHAHVCELGVCHRDVSYFNVLCKPKHYITIHPLLNKDYALERPCIKKIFGDADGQPCALLTDLDHATTLDELAKQPLEDAEIVGTPMFMSVYLATPDVPRKFLYQRLRGLFRDLTAAETTRHDLFRLAFPHGDGGFVEKFKCVMADEDVRDEDVPRAPLPPFRQDPRHDAESIYWVFLHASARALPLGMRQEDVPETDYYNMFCRAMLSSPTKPSNGSTLRETWLAPGMLDGDLFAPQLRRLALLFGQMARYLYIPWHLYCGEGQPMADLRTHVHVAFRRLILAFKLNPDNAEVLRVALDTAQPRYTSIFDHNMYNFAMPEDDGEDADASDSEKASSTNDMPAPCGQKRKAETESAPVTGEDKHASKKPRTSRLASADAFSLADGGAAQHDDVAQDVDPNPGNVVDGAIHANYSTIDDANAVLLAILAEHQVNAPVNQRKVPEPKPEERYDPALHRDSLSAKALRLMFLKDKALWFGNGKY